MKMIRIEDDLYNKLAKEAARDGRSLTKYVDRKLRNATDNVHTGPKEDSQVVAENEYLPDPEFGPSVESMLNSGMIKKGF